MQNKSRYKQANNGELIYITRTVYYEDRHMQIFDLSLFILKPFPRENSIVKKYKVTVVPGSTCRQRPGQN